MKIRVASNKIRKKNLLHLKHLLLQKFLEVNLLSFFLFLHLYLLQLYAFHLEKISLQSEQLLIIY